MSRASPPAPAISMTPFALSVIGPNVSIASTYAAVMSMPIVATAVPEEPRRMQHRSDCDVQEYDRERHRDEVAPVERVHRVVAGIVLDFPPERHQKEPTHGGKHAERAHDQWKDHPRGIIRVEINS